ncbi:transposase [Nocardia brasiliensis]|uniref:transposase n=1 Tax=Nocardia brasiliensis TaxID=37326 RepID=UPI003D7ABF72
MTVCRNTFGPGPCSIAFRFDQPAPNRLPLNTIGCTTHKPRNPPNVVDHLDTAPRERAVAYRVPQQIRSQIWNNNPQERLNKEHRHRSDGVRIYPTRGSITRLVGTILTEQHDEWVESRRYLGPQVLARSRDLTTDGRRGTPPQLHHAPGLDPRDRGPGTVFHNLQSVMGRGT